MLFKKIVIRNPIGLHARPVVQLATVASNYTSNVWLSCKGLTANAKSSVRLLALGVNNGDAVELVVDGEDEKLAFDNMLAEFSRINGE